MSSEIIAALIGGGFAIIGVAVGNYSARKTAQSQEQMRLLAEFYAEVFSSYTAAAPFIDQQKCLTFMGSAEKAKLFCSDESAKILNELEYAITEPHPSAKECGEIMSRLRESAKKDLRKR